MSRPFSRPRTRIYNANYDIGENYYRPTIDRLDRKYSGRPLSPARQTSLPRDLLERHERAFAEEDLGDARSRASKRITEANAFDARATSLLMDAENDIDEETATKLQRIRANKKVSIIDDIEMNGTMSELKTRRMKERADKLLDAVGINSVEEVAPATSRSYQRRALKITTSDAAAGDSSDLTRWSKVGDSEESSSSSSAAAARARASRVRLDELEDEMNVMAEKAAARERRAARLRQIVAENSAENEAASSSVQKSTRIASSTRTVRSSKAVEF